MGWNHQLVIAADAVCLSSETPEETGGWEIERGRERESPSVSTTYFSDDVGLLTMIETVPFWNHGHIRSGVDKECDSAPWHCVDWLVEGKHEVDSVDSGQRLQIFLHNGWRVRCPELRSKWPSSLRITRRRGSPISSRQNMTPHGRVRGGWKQGGRRVCGIGKSQYPLIEETGLELIRFQHMSWAGLPFPKLLFNSYWWICCFYPGIMFRFFPQVVMPASQYFPKLESEFWRIWDKKQKIQMYMWFFRTCCELSQPLIPMCKASLRLTCHLAEAMVRDGEEFHLSILSLVDVGRWMVDDIYANHFWGGTEPSLHHFCTSIIVEGWSFLVKESKNDKQLPNPRRLQHFLFPSQPCHAFPQKKSDV